MPSGSGYTLAVSVRQDDSHSSLLSTSGSVTGAFPLVDNAGFVTNEANGDFLYAARGVVDTYDPSGAHLLSSFGSSQIEGVGLHTGGPYQFYYQGQAVAGPNGVIYSADPLRTIEATSQDGVLEGSTTLGGTLSVAGSNIYLEGGNFYLEGGTPFSRDNNVSEVPLSTLEAYLAAPQAPLDTLGWGAGLDTPEQGNYFPPGTNPQVTADFSSSWTGLASDVKLGYSVESASEVASEAVPKTTLLNLPTAASSLASVPLTIPSGDTGPGPYEVLATLYDTSSSPPRVLGSTCLPYTVGATGDRARLGHSAARHRGRRAFGSPRCRSQLPTRLDRPPGTECQLEQLPAAVHCDRSYRRHVRSFRDDLRQGAQQLL